MATIYGKNKSETLKGTINNDTIYGRGGNDRIYGGNKNDKINGGLGDDSLYGGSGSDTFYFSKGKDIIKDFHTANDKINLTGSHIYDYDDLLSALSMNAAGSVVKFIDGSTLSLQKVDASKLKISNFTFDTPPKAKSLGTIKDSYHKTETVTLTSPDLFAMKMGSNSSFDLKLSSYAGTIKYAFGKDLNGDGKLAINEVILVGQASKGAVKDQTVLVGKGSYLLSVEAVSNPAKYKLDLTQKSIGALPTDETTGSNVAVTSKGIAASGFNAKDASLTFLITGQLFGKNPSDIMVLLNGNALPSGSVKVGSDGKSITVVGPWAEGQNVVELSGVTSGNSIVASTAEFWSGAEDVTVKVVGSSGAVLANASVVAYLIENPDIRIIGVTNKNGIVIFKNLPAANIAIEAKTSDGKAFGYAAATGQTDVIVKAQTLGKVSTIDNNDFADGADGWNVGGSNVTILDDHSTSGAGLSKALALSSAAAASVDSGSSTGKDLVLTTSGEGEQHISRVFKVDPGTNSVTIRYQFVTSEVPGGYFGSQYNDYYRVTIQSDGVSKSDFNSMNGLGLAAFDFASGATQFRELTLTLPKGATTVKIDVAVANVADGALDSSVRIDKVDEKNLAIAKVQLNDIDNTKLKYLSVDSENTHFGGNTRVNGTISITGDKDDKLKDVDLNVIQNGKVVAHADLTDSARLKLINVALGEDKKISIDTSQNLFKLSNSEAAKIGVTKDGSLSFQIVAKSVDGEEATFDYKSSVEILTQFEADKRYGGADEAVGGDNWILPSASDVLSYYEDKLTFGDMSNMNGGKFSPHQTHNKGHSADLYFDGYNSRNATVAKKMIELLNDDAHGSDIKSVYVTFAAQNGNAFYDAIKNVTLDDGRAATSVIKNVAGHTTHFHWEIFA